MNSEDVAKLFSKLEAIEFKLNTVFLKCTRPNSPVEVNNHSSIIGEEEIIKQLTYPFDVPQDMQVGAEYKLHTYSMAYDTFTVGEYGKVNGKTGEIIMIHKFDDAELFIILKQDDGVYIKETINLRGMMGGNITNKKHEFDKLKLF